MFQYSLHRRHVCDPPHCCSLIIMRCNADLLDICFWKLLVSHCFHVFISKSLLKVYVHFPFSQQSNLVLWHLNIVPGSLVFNNNMQFAIYHSTLVWNGIRKLRPEQEPSTKVASTRNKNLLITTGGFISLLVVMKRMILQKIRSCADRRINYK